MFDSNKLDTPGNLSAWENLCQQVSLRVLLVLFEPKPFISRSKLLGYSKRENGMSCVR